MPGPSSLSLRNNGGGRKDPREDDDEQQEEEDDDDDHDDTQDDSDYFPVSHEAIMKDHTKAVTALAIDPAGARLVTGGYDYDVKMWDFGGMQADFRPFRSMEPYENYHVRVACPPLLHKHGTSWTALTGLGRAPPAGPRCSVGRDGEQLHRRLWPADAKDVRSRWDLDVSGTPCPPPTTSRAV